MRLTIFRGTHEIGGNCVELATDSTRIIIDVGMPLVNADREPFDARALNGKSVEELVVDGTLPRVPGLFDGDPPPAAILLSHAHADHTGLLKYTNPTIPVYLSKGTSKMMHAGSIFAGQPGTERGRENIFEPEKPFQIGDFTITAYRVDHSVFDSQAFIIAANDKRVLYSGDLRLHGRKPWMAERLVEAARQRPIDVMLMEGTHLSRSTEEHCTEEELENQIVVHIKSAPGLVLASFSPMHVDRLVSFYKASRRTDRTFVVDPYAAYVMYLVSAQCKIPQPTHRAGIRVYYNSHFERTYQRRGLQKIYRRFSPDRIALEEIRAEPDNFVTLFRPSMVDLDFEGTLPLHVLCLYSFWSGYLAKPEWQSVNTAIEAASGHLVETHTSGHIVAEKLVEFVRAIQPRTLVPIHTFEPHRFGDFSERIQLLEDGQSIKVGSDFECS